MTQLSGAEGQPMPHGSNPVQDFAAKVQQLKQQSAAMQAMLSQQQKLLLDSPLLNAAGSTFHSSNSSASVPAFQAHGLVQSPCKAAQAVPPKPITHRTAAAGAAHGLATGVQVQMASSVSGQLPTPTPDQAAWHFDPATLATTATTQSSTAPAAGAAIPASQCSLVSAAAAASPGSSAPASGLLPAPPDPAAAAADWWLDSSPIAELRAALRSYPLTCSHHDTGCSCQQGAPVTTAALTAPAAAATSCTTVTHAAEQQRDAVAAVPALGVSSIRQGWCAGAALELDAPGPLALGESRLRASYQRALQQLHQRWQRSRQQLQQHHQQEMQQQATAHASTLQQLLAAQQALLAQLGAGGEWGSRLAAFAQQQEQLAVQVAVLARQVGSSTSFQEATILQLEEVQQRQEAAAQETTAALQLLRAGMTHTAEQLESKLGRQEVLALVEGATAAALDEVAGRYASALAAREAHHAALLSDLASLRTAACDAASDGTPEPLQQQPQQQQPRWAPQQGVAGPAGAARSPSPASRQAPTAQGLPLLSPAVLASATAQAGCNSSNTASFAAWQQQVLQQQPSMPAQGKASASASARAANPWNAATGASTVRAGPSSNCSSPPLPPPSTSTRLLDELLGLGPDSPQQKQQQQQQEGLLEGDEAAAPVASIDSRGKLGWSQVPARPTMRWPGATAAARPGAAAGTGQPQGVRSPPQCATVPGLSPAERAAAFSLAQARAHSAAPTSGWGPTHPPPSAAAAAAAAVLARPSSPPAATLQRQPAPPAVLLSKGASGDAAAALTGACLRCGLSDVSSPGYCCFHPALLAQPGPLLYSPQWHACKAAGHTPDMPGCYHRAAHYYMYPPEPVQQGARPMQRGAAGTLGSPPRSAAAGAAGVKQRGATSPGRRAAAVAGRGVCIHPRWGAGPGSPGDTKQAAPQPRSKVPLPHGTWCG